MQQIINLIDQRLISLITGFSPSWRPLMEAASLIGQPVAMAGILVAIILGARSQGNTMLMRGGILMMVTLLGSNALKLILQRTRPDTYIPRLYHSYSFPSGHAFATIAVLGMIAWLCWRHLAAPWGLIVAFICAAIVALVGVSRVYLGAHYPTDVLGGWLLGGIVLTGVIIWARL